MAPQWSHIASLEKGERVKLADFLVYLSDAKFPRRLVVSAPQREQGSASVMAAEEEPVLARDPSGLPVWGTWVRHPLSHVEAR